MESVVGVWPRVMICDMCDMFIPLSFLFIPPSCRKQQTASERTGALPVQKALAPRAPGPSRCVAMLESKATPPVVSVSSSLSCLTPSFAISAGSLNTPRTLGLTRFLRKQRRAASGAMGEWGADSTTTSPGFLSVRNTFQLLTGAFAVCLNLQGSKRRPEF